MKFSVLIPVYNTEKYLEECLQSVLNQTYQDFEIVLVDDGSTDKSGAVCDKYHQQYQDKIKVVHTENKGSFFARRTCIDIATGDYSIFVDSDDYILPESLEKIESVLVNDKDIDMLIYSLCYVNSGEFTGKYPRAYPDGKEWNSENRNEMIFKLIFTDIFTSLCTKAIRTSLLKSDNKDYSQFLQKNMADDFLQSLYLVTYAQKVVYYYFPLYCYRYNSESTSRDYNPKCIEKQNKIHTYSVLMEYLKIWGIDSSDMRNRVDGKWFDDTMYLFFKCYENSTSKQNRNDTISFNWDSMLPNTNLKSFMSFANNEYIKIYLYWKENRNFRIRMYFLVRSLYQKYKLMKKRTSVNE